MSNSREQSVDEEAVFLPVTEACPEFLHCESERLALETLLSVGPGAFYDCLGTEGLGCFLSQEEVHQMSGWAQEYAISRPQVGVEESGEEDGSATQDFSSCYFPTHSDTPAPCLELGWPERSAWTGRDFVKVYTSPPEDGQPPVREIIRRYLQRASQVIAIVTDRLTDNAVIGDLHNAASRGVPVYIILNQRSIQGDFTPSKLRHPHMQVRVLGGKTFCSREGKMVVGQMKDNYILVDLETVIHGSYSLTWSDAHLHRQLVTLLSGPVIGSFDREFRILFAASLPVPDIHVVPRMPGNLTHPRLKEPPDLRFTNRSPLEPLSSPPPPPVQTPLDWEALGVFRRDSSFTDCNQPEGVTPIERSIQNAVPFEKQTSILDEFSRDVYKHLDDGGKTFDKTTPVANNLEDIQSSFNTQLSLSAEIQKRVGHKVEPAYNRKILKDSSTDRRDHPRMGDIFDEECFDTDGTSIMPEKQPSSRKPLILRVPQSDHYSSLSDIMRRLQPQKSSSAHQRRGSKMVSEMSRSLMDLSAHNTDSTPERGAPVPRLQANYFDPDRMTPAIALMKKRNDEIKSGMYRTSNLFQPSARPRSSNIGLQMDWRRPQTDRDAKQTRMRSREEMQGGKLLPIKLTREDR